MADWQAGDVNANGVRLHYTRTGGSGPAVLLLHGVTDDGLCWTPVAEALAPNYDVIMLDARGHGGSEAPEAGYDTATQAADVNGAIGALGLHKPAVLGHSMGAATALALAGLYPEAPAAVLLEDPPGWWAPPGPGTVECRTGMRAWFTEIRSKTRDELIVEGRTRNPGWAEAELAPWAESKLRFSPLIAGVLSPGVTIDWPAILQHVTCPVLAISADNTFGSVLRPEAVTALQELVPHVEVAHIPGAGHNIRRDQFAPFMQVITAFLSRVTA